MFVNELLLSIALVILRYFFYNRGNKASIITFQLFPSIFSIFLNTILSSYRAFAIVLVYVKYFLQLLLQLAYNKVNKMSTMTAQLFLSIFINLLYF